MIDTIIAAGAGLLAAGILRAAWQSARRRRYRKFNNDPDFERWYGDET